MIRDAGLDDIPALLEMGRRFAWKAGFQDHIGFDDASVVGTLTALIEQDNGVCLIGDESMMGAVLYPHPFNKQHIAATELFWFSEGREGLSMLSVMEERVRDSGASSFTMATMEVVNAERMGRLYQARGFIPLDKNYIKVL